MHLIKHIPVLQHKVSFPCISKLTGGYTNNIIFTIHIAIQSLIPIIVGLTPYNIIILHIVSYTL